MRMTIKMIMMVTISTDDDGLSQGEPALEWEWFRRWVLRWDELPLQRKPKHIVKLFSMDAALSLIMTMNHGMMIMMMAMKGLWWQQWKCSRWCDFLSRMIILTMMMTLPVIMMLARAGFHMTMILMLMMMTSPAVIMMLAGLGFHMQMSTRATQSSHRPTRLNPFLPRDQWSQQFFQETSGCNQFCDNFFHLTWTILKFWDKNKN